GHVALAGSSYDHRSPPGYGIESVAGPRPQSGEGPPVAAGMREQAEGERFMVVCAEAFKRTNDQPVFDVVLVGELLVQRGQALHVLEQVPGRLAAAVQDERLRRGFLVTISGRDKQGVSLAQHRESRDQRRDRLRLLVRFHSGKPEWAGLVIG